MPSRNQRLSTALLGLSLLAAAPGLAQQPPARIVSTDAGVTELLLALGAGDRLVAVDDSSTLPAGRELPRLGYHRALAAEGMVALTPDLVIGAPTMGPPHVVEALQRSGIALLQLPAPLTLEQLRDNIARLQRTLAADAAAAAHGALLAELDARAARLATLRPARPPRAAFLLRAEGGKLRMAGSDTAGAAFIAVLGARNLADYKGYRSLSAEALLALEPELLLFADTEAGAIGDLTASVPLLRFSPALQQGRGFTVDAATLVAGLSLAALDEALRIATALADHD